MKYATLSKSLVLAAIIAVAAIPGFAATTGTIGLTATMAENTAVTVTNVTAVTLGTVITNQQVASVNELSNKFGGYTLTMTSANSGKLVAAGITDTVTYSLTYGATSGSATAVTYVGGTATLSTPATKSTSISGVTNNMYISIPGTWYSAGTYTDTLTLTILGK